MTATVACGRGRATRRSAAPDANTNPLVDAMAVREHLGQLVSYGLPPRSIGQAGGVARNTVLAILDGRQVRCHRGVAAALLGVTTMPRPGQDIVLAVGAVRRVHGLAMQAWSLTSVARELGVAAPNLSHVCARKLITYDMWAAVRDVTERLAGQRGPSVPAQTVALHRGWLPLAAWPANRIDDPVADPLPRHLWRTPCPGLS